MRWLPLTLVLALAIVGDTHQTSVSLEDRLVHGLNEFIRTGIESHDLKNALDSIKAPYKLRNFDGAANPVVCTLCNVAARMLISYRQGGAPQELLTAAVKKLCIGAKIETETVCNGVIDLNIPIFIYIIDNKLDLTPEKICGTIGQALGCPLPADDSTWNVELPSLLDQPSLKDYLPKEDKPIRVLQMTDIHFDELYQEGNNALCGEPVCCGPAQGPPATPEAKAGYWADYRTCDMPWYTVLNLMDQVTKEKADYIYYTGDIISHRVWETSVEKNTKDIKKLYALFRERFHSIPVFPILGNHESNPLNEFTTNEISDPHLSTHWLYNLVADEWSHWLPKSTQETIRKGGYYTVLVKPGFRIVALNSNVAYTFNWWLLYDHKALQEQLQWLADTLYEAEKAGEQVHILSHLPTGENTCIKKWGHEYYRIIQRFSHVISAQFLGHTHNDELNIYFNNSNIMEPMSVAYNGGSFTTFINVNPNYKMYDVNPSTWEVEDIHEWIYNLTEANEHGKNVAPRWFKLYSFKEAYGLESMSLQNLGNLLKSMPDNQSTLDKYFRYKYREGDLFLEEGCNQSCHELNLCNIVTTEYGRSAICEELQLAYRKNIQNN